MNSSTSAFTVDEVLKASWSITKDNWKKYFILLGACAIVLIAYGIVFGLLDVVVGVPGIVDDILSFLVSIYVTILITRGSLAIVRGHFDMGEITKLDGKMYLQMLLATLLFYLVVIIGTILLIIPGIIASVMFCFYSFSIVDKRTDAIPSLEDSKNMTYGSKMTIFLFNLVLGLISLAAIVIPGIVAIALGAGAGAADFGPGSLIVFIVLALIVMVASGIILGMVGMSGQAYMYTKLRAKSPLAIKK